MAFGNCAHVSARECVWVCVWCGKSMGPYKVEWISFIWLNQQNKFPNKKPNKIGLQQSIVSIIQYNMCTHHSLCYKRHTHHQYWRYTSETHIILRFHLLVQFVSPIICHLQSRLSTALPPSLSLNLTNKLYIKLPLYMHQPAPHTRNTHTVCATHT